MLKEMDVEDKCDKIREFSFHSLNRLANIISRWNPYDGLILKNGTH